MAAQRHAVVAMGTGRSQSVLLLGPLNSAPAALASIFSVAAMGTTEMLHLPLAHQPTRQREPGGHTVEAGLLEHEVTQFQLLLWSRTFKFKVAN